MIFDSLQINNALETLILQNSSFVMFRKPDERVFRFIMQTSGSPHILHDLEELNKQSGYVIAPFHHSKKCPIVCIRPDTTELPESIVSHSGHPCLQRSKNIPNDEKRIYSQLFKTFMYPLEKGEFKKLVLSREVTIDRPKTFSAGTAFLSACNNYPNAYVSISHTPYTGTWLGCSPEILLSGRNNQWKTVALAGTLPLLQGNQPGEWDDKNRKEQQLVALYQLQQLRSLGIQATEQGPYNVYAGKLMHLRSDIFFSLPNSNRLGSLLKTLHPTPAVCGFPKEKAYQFIVQNEGYDRSYYSGFIGELNPEGQTDLFVNLRCMNIQNDTLTLYAGGGLLASSALEDEWKETEDKLQTMLSILM